MVNLIYLECRRHYAEREHSAPRLRPSPYATPGNRLRSQELQFARKYPDIAEVHGHCRIRFLHILVLRIALVRPNRVLR